MRGFAFRGLLLLGIVLSSVTGYAASNVDPTNALYCYVAAERSLPLGKEQMAVLCSRAESTFPVECYRRADVDARLALNKNQLALLCSGASSLAPIECFVQADKVAWLKKDQAASLCSGALSNAPVECYLNAYKKLWVSEDQGATLCRERR